MKRLLIISLAFVSAGATMAQISISSSAETINGHECVDLGLSVKWATRNVGAASPEDYGNYYQWGATSTPTEGNYSEGNCETYGKNISDIGGTSRDVARAKWGGSWRMPTKNECEELVNNCTWTWTTFRGMQGYRVTSNRNGNSIFLPAAGSRCDTSLALAGTYGRYWCATPSVDEYSDTAFYLDFADFYQRVAAYYVRSTGFPIRPVTK